MVVCGSDEDSIVFSIHQHQQQLVVILMFALLSLV
jgi:hypothetical protein